MARNHPLSPLTYLCLLLPLLFSGCAAGPQASKLSPAQAAQNAVVAKEYPQAVKRFEELSQKNEMQDEYRYDYGLSLSETGHYAEAIEQLNLYIEKRTPNSAYFSQALGQLERTRLKLKKQENAENRAKEIQSRLSALIEVSTLPGQHLSQKVQAHEKTIIEPVTGMEMVLVAGGCLSMGDQFGDGNADERPVHETCVDDYYIGIYEVTQGQWRKIMGYNNSRFQKSEQHPVEMVSWQEAVDFTQYLSNLVGSYRLPTEAEWEYAARSGGLIEKFSGSNDADPVAWHEENSAGSSQPVGHKQPNGLGIYDMSGNVYEWCQDRYAADYYQKAPKQNPTGSSIGNNRTRRGGSWDSQISYSRVSYRTARPEKDFLQDKTGFRVVLPIRN